MSISVKQVSEKTLTSLKDYCHFAKDGDFLSIVEWSNGEGVTVNISAGHNLGSRSIQLTYGELDAIQALLKFQGQPEMITGI